MIHKYAIFQTNEISYLTSCIKTASYGVADLTIKAPKWDRLGNLRELQLGDRIFIHLKGRLYSGPFFVTTPHPQFVISDSAGSWHRVNVEQTPPEERPIWLFDKPWCLFVDRDLSSQVNYCFAGLLLNSGFRLPPMGIIDSVTGERLWEMIDENGSPFSDFLQRQAGFAYHGFPKSHTISFHASLATKQLIGASSSPTRYRTRNGILVRSKSEALIANLLHDRTIRFEYERPLLLDRVFLRPDFYLPDCKVYIEFLGLYHSNPEYRKDWEWKQAVYSKHSVPVVTLFESDVPELDSILLRKLTAFGCK